MKLSKKFLSVLLAVLLLATTMALCAVPASALDATGSCGTNLTYTYNTSTGAVTISGTGSSISSEAFKNHPEIKSVSICSSVTSIGTLAFAYCTNLERVSLPSNLRTIDYMAFSECDKLEDILIPASVTAIEKRAFSGCALKKVMIPSGVTSLNSFVFEGCLNLETVIIDTTLTTINDYAFNSCLALKDVYYKGSERDWNNGVSIGRYNAKLKSATMHYNTASNVKLVQITLSASPASYGTVSGGGIYMTGESVTIKATPNSGYVFDGWYYRDNKISTNATYTFAAAADGALTADFRKARTCTVSVSASPSAGGTVTGGGTYTEGQTATVKATSNSGYKFNGWYQGSTLKSSSANYSFIVTGGVSLTAKFQKTYTVSVSASPTAGGTVTGGGTYAEGATTTLTATSNPGWNFVGFYDANGERIGNTSPTFIVTQNVTYTAKFVHVAAIPTIKLSTDPLNDGDWYLDRDAMMASLAAFYGISVEEFKEMFGDSVANIYAKYDPQTGIIVLLEPGTDVEDASVLLPSDDGYAMYKAGIKQYHAPAPQPQNVCKWCGKVHEGFFQGIIGFFHRIFAAIFGAKY